MAVKFDVLNRFTGAVQFTAEIDADESASHSVKLGLAVRWGLKSGADLSRADLSRADFSWVNFSGVDLSRANLSGANLSRADLSRADLSGADLSRADLSGADLSWADLSRANLSWADLSWANLSGADLSGADLSWAYLSGANLSGANLSGAKWRDDITISRVPLFVSGLHYQVWILDQHMQIGCELHSLADWAGFDERRIAGMDGKAAITFWRAHKDTLLDLAASDGCDTEAATPTEGEAA